MALQPTQYGPNIYADRSTQNPAYYDISSGQPQRVAVQANGQYLPWDQAVNFRGIGNADSEGTSSSNPWEIAVNSQGTNPSSNFGFEQYVLPAMTAAIGMGAGGFWGGGTEAGAAGGSVSMAQGGPMDWANTYAGGSPENFYTPETSGGFQNSIMNNPYAGGGGVQGVTDFSSAGLGTVGAGGAGIGTGAGSLMGDAGMAGATAASAGGSSLFDTISDFLKTPIGGAVGNVGTSLLTGGMLRGLANKQANYSSLDQSQRQPYQGNLSQLVNNPSKYLTTDPFATSLAAMYRDKIIPRSIAQSGNPGQVLDEKGSQFVNALAGNYNTQMGNLSGIAGFGFPQSQYAGYGAGQIGVGAASQFGNAVAGLGNAFGKDFSKVMQGQSGTSGPFGTYNA